MKKKFISLSASMLLAFLIFTACQKEIKGKDEIQATDNYMQQGINDDYNCGCKLNHVDYGTGNTLDFKYNEKGLANEVLLTYSDGFTEQHSIFYDNKNRIIRTRILFSNGTVIIYDFSHSGNFITRANGYYEGTNAPWRDILYTYNQKGQMTNFDDVVQDLHLKYAYNNQGYNSHGELYFGTTLVYSYDHEFKIPNRNPFLAVPGVPFGFWDVFLPLWNMRWQSRDQAFVYDNGSPIAIQDTDPAKTTMKTGPQNYLSSTTQYDMISATTITKTMIYQDCGGGYETATLSASHQLTPMTPAVRLQRILMVPSNNIKEQLLEFKNQY